MNWIHKFNIKFSRFNIKKDETHGEWVLKAYAVHYKVLHMYTYA